MKKIILVFFAFVIFIYCEKKDFKLNTDVGDVTSVQVDTVSNYFSITFAPTYDGCITEFGADLYFDNNLFEFITDSTIVYNNFGFEIVNHIESDRISLGFSSNDIVCSFTENKYIFTLFFRVKDSNFTESKMYIDNVVLLDKNGVRIGYDETSGEVQLVAGIVFKCNWIIKNY